MKVRITRQMKDNTERLQPFTAKETATYYATGEVPERYQDTAEERRKEILSKYAPPAPQSNYTYTYGGYSNED